jgi:uncharacterized protein (TIGR03435 family)
MPACLTIAILLSAPALAAQSQDPAGQPAFEVASVKASTPSSPFSRTLSHGNFAMFSYPLAAIIAWAYDLPRVQVEIPQAAASLRFDIAAKAAAPVPEAQVRLMLRTLLAERFKLAVHRQVRELQVMVMTAAKGTSRLKPSDDENPMASHGDRSKRQLEFEHTTMAELASFLSGIGPPVVDRTGIAGRYDFSVPYAAFLDPSDDSTRAVFAAYREAIPAALGLNIQPKKLLLDVLVVDQVEQVPSPN